MQLRGQQDCKASSIQRSRRSCILKSRSGLANCQFPLSLSFILLILRHRMDERRELWVARGWSNEYIHVEVASSSNGVATNGSAEGVVVNGAEEYQSKCSIPLRVFGEHPLSVATLSNGN